MGIRGRKQAFDGQAGALQDIARSGFWPTTLVTPPGPELPMHWHDSDVHAYVIAGESYMRCGETGERLATGPGDIVEIPLGALHAEGETATPMTYLVAAPTTRALREYLKIQQGPVTGVAAAGD